MCLILMSYAVVAQAQSPIPDLPVPDPGPPLLGAGRSGVIATADTEENFTLPSGSTLSGMVIDAAGMPVLNATVFAQAGTEGYSAQLVPQTLGSYRIVLPDGTYSLFLQTQINDPTVPVEGGRFITYDLQETVVVAGDTEKNIVTPESPEFVTVSGPITNSATLPINGSLRFQTQSTPAEPSPVTMGSTGAAQIIDVISGAVVQFPAEGVTETTYSLTVPVGTFEVTYLPTFFSFVFDPENPMLPPTPDVVQTASLSLGTLTVSGDMMQGFVLPDTVTLSGLVLDENDGPLIPSTVTAVSGGELLGDLPEEEPVRSPCSIGLVTSNPLVASSSASQTPGFNTMGNYELTVVPGDYRVIASSPVVFGPPTPILTRQIPPPDEEPQFGLLQFPFLLDNVISIPTDLMMDFRRAALPPDFVISGVVLDEDGMPVENALVSATSSMITNLPDVFFMTSAETGADGTYQLPVLSGTDYQIEVCPEEPENSVNIPLP